MNPDQPSREQIETRITALLLGELPAEEAELLRYTIGRDPALQQLHDELQSTLALVREAAKNPEEPSEQAPLRLSSERRQKLLAHFKTPRPKADPEEPLSWLKPINVSPLIALLACIAIMAILAAMLLPALSKAKNRAQLGSSSKWSELKDRIWSSDNESQQARQELSMGPSVNPRLPAGGKPASPAKLVTLTAAPMLAPPPAAASNPNTQIVLPQAEPPIELAAKSDAGQISTFAPQIPGHLPPETPGTMPPAQPIGWLEDRTSGAGRAGEPVAVALGPEPELTPPPIAAPSTPMVLPPTELARQLTVQNVATSQIYSQNIVGYVNVPANAVGIPFEADNLGLAKPAQKEWVVPGQSAESANPTAGKTAVSALAGAHGILIRNYEGYYGHPSDSNDRNVLAINDSGANRTFATTPAFKPELEAPKIVEAERHAATVNLFKTAPAGITSSLRGFYDDKVGGKPTISGATPPATDVNEDGAARSPSPALAENKIPLRGKIPAVGSLFNTPGTTPSQYQNSALTTRQINNNSITDQPLRKPAPDAPVPQPEILTTSNAFSTFALNVSDVSFKLAEASLQNNKLPDAASIRSEEFINAFDYRDPEAPAGQPMAFASELARYPFAQNRELLRFAVKTAAAGRQQGRALNLVLLLDVSGSMERADRVAIIHEALRVLATQLQPQDIVSVVTFARTAHLWADGVTGDKAAETLDRVGGITPEGGTNLEEAMRLAYETARRHYLTTGMNRVVLLTDGAANLGNVEPAALKEKVETQRRQGIALDCFGIGWEDFNDDLLEDLSSHGDGRYAFLNSPEDAAKDFAAKLAGALQIAAADVKVQVEFNPARVISYRQIGYAKHQLTKEQFRDNTVAAGEIAAQEAGNALYTIETNPGGQGPIATVHVRYRVPGTTDYREHSWDVPYTGKAPALDHSSPAMRLAATASAFSEWLAASPYAQEVTPDELLKLLSGVPQAYGADDRPKQLETMIREAKSANYDPRGKF